MTKLNATLNSTDAVILTPLKRCKRSRTECFLDKSTTHEGVTRTCMFLESQISKILKIQLTESKNGSSMAANSDIMKIKTVGENIRKRRDLHNRQFTLFRQALEEESRKKIGLRKAYDYVVYGIESLPLNDSSAFPLSMLNQGHETTAEIKALIGAYAGVPCGDEMADWHELSIKLRTRNDS